MGSNKNCPVVPVIVTSAIRFGCQGDGSTRVCAFVCAYIKMYMTHISVHIFNKLTLQKLHFFKKISCICMYVYVFECKCQIND